MARRKPARVDWIKHHGTGEKVALRLNKTKMVFEAEYGGEEFTSKDGEEVRNRVLEAISAARQLRFGPVIGVEFHKDCASGRRGEDFEAGFNISVTRFYFAAEGGNCGWKVKWDDYEEAGESHRLRRWNPVGFRGREEEFALPHIATRMSTYGSDHCYLPYTEETWTALEHVVDFVNSMGDKIGGMFTSPDVLVHLDAVIAFGACSLLKEED